MKPSRFRILVAVVLVVLAGVLFFALKPGASDDNSDDTPAVAAATGASGASGPDASVVPKPDPVPAIIFRDGEVVGGEIDIDVTEGDQIKFKVKSDVDEEIHVHGYDISADVAAGGTAVLDFKADITGIFEAEMEGSGIPIAKIQINP